MSEHLLEISDLRMDMMTHAGIIHTLRGVNLTVEAGEVHGVVGESGSGKSMLVKSVMRLHDEKRSRYTGSVLLDGRDVLALNRRAIMDMRGKTVSMIFQDPMNSLDPIMKVGRQLTEVLRKKEGLGKQEAREAALALLRVVGLEPAEQRIDQYPFEMSGGMQQRVMIAMAIACRPKLLIADEPTTALDVTIQLQILKIIRELRDTYGMGVILVTHNLGVVAEICDRVSVMYAGRIVEDASVRELFDAPLHPYTKALMASSPSKGKRGEEIPCIPGEPPSPDRELTGCAFADRCPYAQEMCRCIAPVVRTLPSGRTVACHFSTEP